jgi:ferredoxin-NADP reductase
MIAQYNTNLVKKNKIAEDTYQLLITKPEEFSFAPGQYAFLDFANPTYTDDRPSFRAMSIASAPHEKHLMFVMRGSKSAFKRNMIEMKDGDDIIVKGPLGHVMLPQNINQPIVFIVAGVGITPARSMIKHEEFQKADRPVTLLYASRTKNSIALYNEMQNINLKNYKAIFTLTREEGMWDGERGRIDEKMIKKYVDDIKKVMYYIVGTKVFVESMKEILENLGIEKNNMQFDNFG